jgi:hypothetical protein
MTTSTGHPMTTPSRSPEREVPRMTPDDLKTLDDVIRECEDEAANCEWQEMPTSAAFFTDRAESLKRVRSLVSGELALVRREEIEETLTAVRKVEVSNGANIERLGGIEATLAGWLSPSTPASRTEETT